MPGAFRTSLGLYPYGLGHAKMCLWAYVNSEGLDQPVHLHSQNRVFPVCKQNHRIL